MRTLRPVLVAAGLLLALPPVVSADTPAPAVPGRAPADLTTGQAIDARPAGAADRRLSLKKRVQRLKRQVARVENQPRSQARAKELRRLRPKVITARAELTRYDAQRQPSSSSTISTGGVAFVAGFEGFVAVPRPDPVGFCTAGYGHLIRRSGCTREDIRKFTLSKKAALELLRQDLAQAVRDVNRLVKVPRTPGQEDALVSFVFNVGPGQQGFGGSTLLRKLNARDYKGAADEFLRWNRAGGGVLAGLTRRRVAEREMFLRAAVIPKVNVATPDVERAKPLPKTAPKGAPKSDNRCVYNGALARGARGRDVRVLQSALRRHGLGLKITGVYDVPTKKSVRTIQRRAKLKQDGVVGSRTLTKLDLSVCPPKLPSVADLRTTIGVDGTPVYRGIGAAFQAAKKRGWNGTVNAGDRRRGVPEKFGRSSQYALYQCWINRVRGCNPANPPGFSTHEQRSDGFAYRNVPRGGLLEWWQMGTDVSDSGVALYQLRQLGFCVWRPYSDPREAQHINFCQNPTKVLQKLGLVARGP